jgi:hypothetical protein
MTTTCRAPFDPHTTLIIRPSEQGEDPDKPVLTLRLIQVILGWIFLLRTHSPGCQQARKNDKHIGPLAQSVEQLTLNQLVEGSSPPWVTTNGTD